LSKGRVVQGARAAKLVPPAIAPPALTRAGLEERLDAGLARRLTIVVAGAGFGKSALLGAWAGRRNTAWYALTPEDRQLASFVRGLVGAFRLHVPDLPADLGAAIEGEQGPDPDPSDLGRSDAYAALLCSALQERLTGDLALVLDDVQELGADGGPVRLVESLVRQAPPALRLVLASRVEPPFPIERLRGQGQVVELTARELAFGPEETRLLLERALAAPVDDIAQEVQEGTGGWPAAVRLALEALRNVSPAERRRTVEGLRKPGSPLFAYLAEEVFDREPPEARALVRAVAPFERFNAELCEAVGIAGAAGVLGSLARRGLFVEVDRGEAGWYSLAALAREFALERLPLPAPELGALRRRAAEWLAARGYDEEALRALADAGAHEELAALLVSRGEAVLSAGAVDTVVRATDSLPPALRTAAIERLAGQARQIQGDWEGALACFARVSVGADDLEAGIAWRAGLIHHLRGNLEEAVAVYARGRLDGSAPRDEALLLAWHASLDWLRGDLEACRDRGSRAHEIAARTGDSQALAAAHTVLALIAAFAGDRAANETHYLRALDHAERAGDVLQIIRVRANRGSRRMEEADYAEAIAELDLALRLADLAGFAFFRGLALSNRGAARLQLGRFEEAIADLEAAKSVYQGIGSRDISYPLYHLGEIYRQRGDLALARAALEEAAGQASEAGDLQGLVPALAGLARVLATEEPDRAAEIAAEAVGYGPGMAYVGALLAAADVELARGGRTRAAELAHEAAAEARARRDRAGLAEALELEAASTGDLDRARSRAEEAIALWREIGSPLGVARAELRLARILGPEQGRALADDAGRRLRALGARGPAALAARLVAGYDEAGTPLAVESLGRFRVLRDGAPVPLAVWQSKKARDLLKLLIARRGRPTPRDVVIEALWPDGDPARVGNRLSVALSTLRSVLDPDRRFEPDRFVNAGRDAISLDLGNLDVDVERFLAEAAAGLDLWRRGEADAARERLVAAEAVYAGDFLEEDAYEDWAVALREEARATYISVARVLGEDALARGERDLAARYLLRSLEKDPYDEEAHLMLVELLASGGRHGEARRAYRTYAARMEEIQVEAVPFPAPGRPLSPR
jgi:ATP/maltotriose-dependent transcriptional regulator MalT